MREKVVAAYCDRSKEGPRLGSLVGGENSGSQQIEQERAACCQFANGHDSPSP
jgi:hypothetical protein